MSCVGQYSPVETCQGQLIQCTDFKGLQSHKVNQVLEGDRSEQEVKNLCLIPARGGSRRIPRKNVKPFVGRPIISYSIEVALKSQLFERVIVSTDDEEIAECARQEGAEVPFLRSSESANDFATLADVIDEVRSEYSRTNPDPDFLCCILATSPLLEPTSLSTGYEMLRDGSDVGKVHSVVRFGYPVQRALEMGPEGDIQMLWPECRRARSQDLEPRYRDAGQFYWMPYQPLSHRHRVLGLEISELDSQDIDTEEDWRLAELKYLQKNGRLDMIGKLL